MFALTGSRVENVRTACLKSVLVVALLTGLGFAVNLRVAPSNMDMLYLAGVVFSALKWGFVPAALSSVISTAVFDYLLFLLI